MNSRSGTATDEGEAPSPASSGNAPSAALYTRFSLTYFFNFSVLAFSLAFFPLLFKKRGFTSTELGYIGTLSVLGTLTGQTFGAFITHRFISAKSYVRCVPCFTFAALLALNFSAVPGAIFLCFFLFQCCHASIFPILDAAILRLSLKGAFSMERVRLWGSFGFIAGNVLAGAISERWGEGLIIPAAASLVLVFLAMIQGVASQVSTAAGSHRFKENHSPALWSKKPAALLLFVVILQWVSHAGMYLFLSVYLRGAGWTPNEISFAWNLGVIAEIAVFFALKPLGARLKLSWLLRLSIALTIARWILIGTASSHAVVLLSQALHGFTFGGFYIASLKLLDRRLPEQLRPKGPTILSTCGNSAGSLIGRGGISLVAANISTTTDFQRLFLLSAGVAAAAFCTSFFVRDADSESVPEELAKSGEAMLA